jgi:hypothetical protein
VLEQLIVHYLTLDIIVVIITYSVRVEPSMFRKLLLCLLYTKVTL